MINIKDTFAELDDEYMEFKRIENPLSSRPDLCAFILLDKLCPGNNDIISASEHDEFYLSIDVEELAKVATKEDILTLNRCGVRYDSGYDCLCMFA